MKINKIEVGILANKSRYYIREEMISLAREHNCFYGSEFGKDFILIDKPTKPLIDKVKELGIKFRKFGK
jgi:hypothetical protein